MVVGDVLSTSTTIVDRIVVGAIGAGTTVLNSNIAPVLMTKHLMLVTQI